MCTTNNPAETPRPAMIINLAKRNANPDEEPELCEEPGEEVEWNDVEFTHPDFSE